jgi:hypothetical protein
MDYIDTDKLVLLERKEDVVLFADPVRKRCVERKVFYYNGLPLIVYQGQTCIVTNMRRVEGR